MSSCVIQKNEIVGFTYLYLSEKMVPEQLWIVSRVLSVEGETVTFSTSKHFPFPDAVLNDRFHFLFISFSSFSFIFLPSLSNYFSLFLSCSFAICFISFLKSSIKYFFLFHSFCKIRKLFLIHSLKVFFIPLFHF